MTEPHDDLESRLRRTLHEGRPGVDTESFLSDVHRGARRRRQRHVVAGTTAAVALVAVGAYGVLASGALDTGSSPAAGRQTTPTATSAQHSIPSTTASASTSPTEATTAPGGALDQPRALSLSATDSQHQYVLLATGSFGCSPPCVEVDVTDDAGATWHPTAGLDLGTAEPDPTSGSANEVRFAGGGEDGWVFGGALRSTHDGGETWTRPTVPAKGIVMSLEAWGDTAYATVGDPQSLGPTTLVRSPVGHDDWQPVNVGTPLSFVTQLAVSQQLVAVLGSPKPVSQANELLVSTDAKTWKDVQPCTKGQWPSSVSTTATSLWTVCSGPGGAAVFVSTDSGNTWTIVPGEFFPGSQVQARDDTTAVVIDSNRTGISLVTVKNQPEHLLADQGDFLPIGFTNPTTGYLRTADGGIVRTLDSGATWQDYPLPQ